MPFRLIECRNLMSRICRNLHKLQEAGFCEGKFSLLVIDEYRPNVARIVPVEITSVRDLAQTFEETLRTLLAEKRHKQVLHREQSEQKLEICKDGSYQSRKLESCCINLLNSLGLSLHDLPSDAIYLWRCTVHVLDLGVLS